MAEKVNILFCLEIWGTCLGLWGLARNTPSLFFLVKKFIKLCPGLLPTSHCGTLYAGKQDILFSSCPPQALLGSVGTLVPAVWPSKQSLVGKPVGVTWWPEVQAV